MALIVVAEDEFLLAELLADFLEDAGYEVALAPHGAAALKLLEERKPDLLISDYMMPLMTGAELAEAVRKHPVLNSIPILLVSGAQAHLARLRPDLFDVVLRKPYTPQQLIKVVEGLLNGKDRSG
jgi:two-component system, OmpR family, phosphate regulon response regulator PhoB